MTNKLNIVLAAAVLLWAVGGAWVFAQTKPTASTFTDTRDGQVYRTVRIGSQVWMAENLRYAADGSVCYDNDTANCRKYGKLYDWETAKKACPAGWKLPDTAEWSTLFDFVGGKDIAGKKLKSTSGWGTNINNRHGTDDYGFTALSGGSGGCDDDYCLNVSFGNVCYIGCWWSTTGSQYMHFINEYVVTVYLKKTHLYSVRCVQDTKKGQRQ